MELLGSVMNSNIINDARITSEDIVLSLANLKQLTFEVTDACNLKCKYCGYGDLYYGYDERHNSFMDFQCARGIIDYLAKIWEEHCKDIQNYHTYISFYGGEPLLNMPLIQKVVQYIEELHLNRNIIFSMTTNATRLNQYMDYLADKKIHLLISLDGDSSNNAYRVTRDGKSSFPKVFQNVRLLQKTYPVYFNENVSFNSVLHNLNSVESALSFIKDNFGKTPTISELNNSNIREDKYEVFEQMYQDKRTNMESSSERGELIDTLMMNDPDVYALLLYLHQYSGNVYNDYSSLMAPIKCRHCIPTGTCIPFGKKMFITVNGKILQCEKISQKFSLGYIHDGTVFLDAEAIAREYNCRLDHIQRFCSSCYRKGSCTQCMYYIDGIDEYGAACQSYMTKEMFDEYEHLCRAFLKEHPILFKKLMTDIIIEN